MKDTKDIKLYLRKSSKNYLNLHVKVALAENYRSLQEN